MRQKAVWGGVYTGKEEIELKIGLIDVDGHNYPNLALMKISAYHKAQGDAVEWWWGWDRYDIVYMSKVFSDTYSADMPDPVNADLIVRGGSGYAIQTVGGIEIYDKDKDPHMPDCVARMMPDYSLYPELTKNQAYGRLTEGCPKKCPWCHVGAMQGTESRQVCDLDEFWSGQRIINLMDPNILACKNREKLLVRLADSGAAVNFDQGLDIGRMDQDVIEILNRMRVKKYHFAWDNPAIDMTDQFAFVGEKLRIKNRASRIVYVLTNFGDSGAEDTLERVYILRSLGFAPYVMIYNKPSAPQILRDIQRWCNNKIIFGACPYFEDYGGRK